MKRRCVTAFSAFLVLILNLPAQPVQLFQSISANIDRFALSRRSFNSFAPDLYNLESFESVKLESGFEISPSLDYSKDGRSAELLGWRDDILVYYKAVPQVAFIMERRGAGKSGSIAWNESEKVETDFYQANYPLGIHFKVASPFYTRPSWIAFQGILQDFDDGDFNVTLGFGDSSLFKFGFSFAFGTENMDEDVTVYADKLDDINPFEGEYSTRKKWWRFNYETFFNYFTFNTFFHLNKSRPQHRGRHYTLADSSRSLSLGFRYRHLKRPLKNLSISYESDWGRGSTEGFRYEEESDDTKRFHFAPLNFFSNSISLGKRWRFGSGPENTHELSVAAAYRYYRIHSHPLNKNDAFSQKRETFNYSRFNPPWFNVSFLGLTASMSEMLSGNFKLHSIQGWPEYAWTGQKWKLAFRMPWNYMFGEGRFEMVSSDKKDYDKSVTGFLLLATPGFTGEFRLAGFSLSAGFGHAIPLKYNLKTSTEEQVETDLLEEGEGIDKAGFTFWKTGLLVRAGLKFEI